MTKESRAMRLPADEEIPRFSARRVLVIRMVKNKMFSIGGMIVVAFILAAICVPSLIPFDPSAMDFSAQFGSPTTTHLMGTDQYGRDILDPRIYTERR